MAKILVVEDERVAAWSIQESLEGFGHTIVASVVSGSEAIQTAETTHPDLVLVDIQLKGQIDGISAAEQIHNHLHIPIIYLTTDHRTRQRAIASDASGYLVKPFNQTELHTTIEIALLRNHFEKRIAAIEKKLLVPTTFSNGAIATGLNGQVVFMHSGMDSVDESVLDLVHAEAEGSEELEQTTPSADLRPASRQIEIDLERQVQERTAQLQQVLDFEALLKRMTDKVRDSLDEGQIIRTAVEELGMALSTNSCDTGLYNLRHGTSTIAYEFIQNDVPSLQNQVLRFADYPEFYEALLAGKSLHFCLLESENLTARPVPGRSVALACPLLNNQEVIGDLWLYRRGGEAFSGAEVRLVQQVANQCAIAIRQARLYTAAQAQVSELERLNHLKDDFLNTISHELRTPISSIKMASQLLEIRLKNLNLLETDAEHTGRYLQILQNECDREINLINNMLDLSRLDAQMEPLSHTPIQLQDWIPHLLEPFTAKIQSQQQQLVIDIPSHLSPIVSDLSSLGRVLTELFNNAFKYTPAHETIKVSAELSSHPLGSGLQNHLAQMDLAQTSFRGQSKLDGLGRQAAIATPCFVISVSNSGVEILPKEQTYIFDKFYRIPNADPWKHGGTGLGLALVKRLIAHLKGDIQVTSQQNWTTFTIYLPTSEPGS
jgi:signal transduction histidine kinase/DNA-binding response OmpR family regulator